NDLLSKSKEMQIMTAPDTTLPARRADDSSLGRDLFAAFRDGVHRLRARLGMRGLVILGAAVIAVGLALNWSWLVAIGVAPLLLAALPCVAMCALGLCSISMGRKTCANHGTGEDARLTTIASSEENGRPLPPKHGERLG